MKTSSINILCATDDNYVPYCGIMLTSVFENNKDLTVCAYILIDKPLLPKNQRKFSQLAKQYDQQIEFVMVDKSLVSDFPLLPCSRYTVAVYYRLLAGSLLSDQISRVLYLDCDIIVNGSLKSLWEVDLSNKSVAAVPDMISDDKTLYERLQYPMAKGYFNSGVLLMNLQYWREQQLMDKLFNFITTYKDRIIWPDQDALNVVLAESKVNIPIKYNYQMALLLKDNFDMLPQTTKEKVLTERNPVIVHYNVSKPWSVSYYNYPYNGLWHKYKRKSPWKFIFDTYPSKKRLRYFIKRWFIWPLGLMKNTNIVSK